jgi:hypothetical protein
MFEQNSFDTICHEHLEYYSLAVLEYIFKQVNLKIFKAEINDINGGSICCFVTHNDNSRFDTPENISFLHKLRIKEFEMELETDIPYSSFFDRINKVKQDILNLIEIIKSKGETIHIYGASTKGNVLLQWVGINQSIIQYAADRNPEKDGAKTIGTNIEIINEEASRKMKPDYYLVLPWHFKKEFLEREKETILSGTKMIFPLPEVSVVDSRNLAEVYDSIKSAAAAYIDNF